MFFLRRFSKLPLNKDERDSFLEEVDRKSWAFWETKSKALASNDNFTIRKFFSRVASSERFPAHLSSNHKLCPNFRIHQRRLSSKAMSEVRKEITHVIFDMDGTLLDTESIYTEVTQEILSEFGKTFTWEIKSQMMGRKSFEAAEILIKAESLPIDSKEFLRRENQLSQTRWSNVVALPGAQEWVTTFHKKKVPIALATGSSTSYFQLKTKRHSWFNCFETIVLGDDPHVARGKPHPDIFLRAAELLNVNPEKVLVFEDAVNGVEAAKRAGMNVVAIPHPLQHESEFSAADVVLRSLVHFDPLPWGLPSLMEQL